MQDKIRGALTRSLTSTADDCPHGCRVEGLSDDGHAVIYGHVDLNALASAVLAALPKQEEGMVMVPRSALASDETSGNGWHEDPRERLSRDRDIILEAINAYDSYMLDDDFNADRTLRKIIERMRDRAMLTASLHQEQETSHG